MGHQKNTHNRPARPVATNADCHPQPSASAGTTAGAMARIKDNAFAARQRCCAEIYLRIRCCAAGIIWRQIVRRRSRHTCRSFVTPIGGIEPPLSCGAGRVARIRVYSLRVPGDGGARHMSVRTDFRQRATCAMCAETGARAAPISCRFPRPERRHPRSTC